MSRALAVSLLALIASPVLAAAQDQPRRPECVAPAKPGGGFDLTCRIAQAALADTLDRPMRVTFMPRGVGAVAFARFNTSRAADPNAIVAFSTGSLLNIATGKFGRWNETDVRFIGTVGADVGAVIVRADGPYQSLDDLMSALHADPASVVIGAGGTVGSQDWMKAAQLLRAVDLDPRGMRYAAFEGGGETIAALLGGHIDVYTGDVGEMTAHIDGGDLAILAVMAPERLPTPFDAIPTARELGYDVEWSIVRGFYAGGDMPDDAYAFWVDAFETAHAAPEFAALQRDHNLAPLNLAGDALQDDVARRVALMRQIARDVGLLQ